MAHSDYSVTVEDLASAFLMVMQFADTFTAEHSVRVGRLAEELGAELGYNECDRLGLRIAGTLHDIGKIAIPNELLTKTGKLRVEEMDLVRTHVVRGYEILSSATWPWPIAEVALQHHERLDGTGYPYHLESSEISDFAKIIAVADVVDAMSAARPYRQPIPLKQVKQDLLMGRGIKYDIDVVNAMIKILRTKQN